MNLFLSPLETLWSHSLDRQALYQQGGLISVTSRILVVDMLLSEIPVELISGIIVLHAEKYVLCIERESEPRQPIVQNNPTVHRGVHNSTLPAEEYGRIPQSLFRRTGAPHSRVLPLERYHERAASSECSYLPAVSVDVPGFGNDDSDSCKAFMRMSENRWKDARQM